MNRCDACAALEAAVKVPPAAIVLHLLLGVLGLVPVQGVWGSLLLKDLVADVVCTYCWTLGENPKPQKQYRTTCITL